MILLGGNKITADMITVTGGSEQLSGDRCVNQIASEWTQFNDNIVIDFGSAVDIDSIAVVNISQGASIEANTTDSWTTPAYSATLDAMQGSDCRVEMASSTQAYRYWRLKATGLTYVGYLYLGEKIQLPCRNFGDMQSLDRFDSKTANVGGGNTVKNGYARKELSATFNESTNDELEEMRDYWNTYGQYPAIIIPYEDEDQTTIDEAFAPFFCNPSFDFGNRSAHNVNNVTALFVETK